VYTPGCRNEGVKPCVPAVGLSYLLPNIFSPTTVRSLRYRLLSVPASLLDSIPPQPPQSSCFPTSTPSTPRFRDVFLTMSNSPTGARPRALSSEEVNREVELAYTIAQVRLRSYHDHFHVTLHARPTTKADARLPTAKHGHLHPQPGDGRTQLGRGHSFAHQK
jgi:hypothetical protein